MQRPMLLVLAMVAVIAACKAKSQPPPEPVAVPTAPKPAPVVAAPADAHVVDAVVADAKTAPIEPTWFDEVEAFANGRAGVRVGDKWGYVDAAGHVVLPIAYDTIGANAPLTWIHDKAGYHVLAGTRVIASKATAVTPFADGVAMARFDSDKHWQLVDGDAKPIGATYARAAQLGDCPLWSVEPIASAAAGSGSDVGAGSAGAGSAASPAAPPAPCVIDKRGQCVAAKRISGQGPFAVSDGAKLGIIDCKGQPVVPFAYDDIKFYGDEGRAWVHDAGGWGLVDHDKLVIPTKLPVRPTEVHDGAVTVKDAAGKIWLADLGGHVFVPGAWEVITHLSDGLALVKIDKKWGVITDAGKLIIEPKFENVNPVSEHRVAFQQAGAGWGFLDDKGTVVIAPTYGYAEHFSSELAVVRTKDGNGYIDLTGNLVLAPTFMQALTANADMAFAKRDDGTPACINFQAGKPPAVHKTAFWPDGAMWFETPGPAMRVGNDNGTCGYISPRCTELTKPDDYVGCDDFDSAGYTSVRDKAPPPEPVQWDPSMSAAPPEPPPVAPVYEILDLKFATIATAGNVNRLAPGVFVISDEQTEAKSGNAGLVVNGVTTIPASYDEVEDEHAGFVGVRRDKKWALFRFDGTPLVIAHAP